jgi:uracil phosphoribosyltransferase
MPLKSRSLFSGFFMLRTLCLICVKQVGYGAIPKKRYNPAIFFVAATPEGEKYEDC